MYLERVSRDIRSLEFSESNLYFRVVGFRVQSSFRFIEPFSFYSRA